MNRYWVIAIQAIVTLALGASVLFVFLSPDGSGPIREIDARRDTPESKRERVHHGRSQDSRPRPGAGSSQRNDPADSQYVNPVARVNGAVRAFSN